MQRRHYSISELTREFGVSTRTLRFYEDEGLLQPERRGRTRLYSEGERLMLKEILRSRRIGLSLSEIKDVLDVFDADGDGEISYQEFVAFCREEDAETRRLLDRVRRRRP